MNYCPSEIRLGLIHIPGSAGTSLGQTLGKLLGCRYVPIHRIRHLDHRNIEDEFTLEIPAGRSSLSREILLSYPLIAGHLSVGAIQATWRSHIILTISEPRVRLIKLFAHHGSEDLTFDQWLAERIDYSSEIISQLIDGQAIPNGGKWWTQHSKGHRQLSNQQWAYNQDLVSHLISPITHIFLSNSPQFVIDKLHKDKILTRHAICGVSNRRAPNRKVNWGDITKGLNALRDLTRNDYRFISQVSKNSHIDSNFTILSDMEVERVLHQVSDST